MSQLPAQSGLVEWFRGDDYTAGSWSGKLGNYTATQATGANQPAAVADGGADFNNLPIVRPDGVNDFLVVTGLTLSQPFTVVVISKLTKDDAANKPMVCTNTTASTQFGFTSSEVIFSFAGTLRAGTTNGLNATHMYEGYFDAGNSFINVDSVRDATLATIGTAGLSGLVMFANQEIAGPSTFFGGDVSDILIYDHLLTHNERTQNAQYAAARYGFAVPFPQTSAPSETQLSTAGTSINVNIPAIEEGELYKVSICANDTLGGTGGAISPPDGTWRELFDENGFPSSSGGNAYACFVKRATADAAATTATFTFTNSSTAAAQAHKISLWGGDVEAHVVAGSVASGLSSGPDSPSLTPGWTDNTLWFSELGATDDDATVNTYPASYTGGADVVSGAGTNAGCTLATAWRENAVVTENPAAYLLSESEAWLAQTVAIRPITISAGLKGRLHTIRSGFNSGDSLHPITEGF